MHTPDADIDVLCLAPKHCTREAFFTSFCAKLAEHPEVDELFPVPEAYTPVSRACVLSFLHPRLVTVPFEPARAKAWGGCL